MMYKKVKRLKTWGLIGGGVLVATGIVLEIAAAANSNFYKNEQKDTYALEGAGIGCIVLGAGVTATCLVIAHKQKKKIDALQTSAIYRYNIPFSNGSRLSFGADMLNDRIMNKRTIGLGLTFNF